MGKSSSTPKRLNRERSNVGLLLDSGSSKIKKKIRDTERLLRKNDLKADFRVDKERELKALKFELQNKDINQKEKKIAKRYHMVRFFERQKAIRKLKQARTALSAVEDTEQKKEIKKAKKVVRHCEVDLAYCILFPKSEKYISLFPKKDGPNTDLTEKAKKGLQNAEERKFEIKRNVEKLIESGALPFDIEEVLAGNNSSLARLHHERSFRGEIDAPELGKDEEEDEFLE